MESTIRTGGFSAGTAGFRMKFYQWSDGVIEHSTSAYRYPRIALSSSFCSQLVVNTGHYSDGPLLITDLVEDHARWGAWGKHEVLLCPSIP